MADFTKCWDCAKAASHGCTWSASLQPVEGWTAVPTEKYLVKGQKIKSFLVTDCPEFERDAWNGGALRLDEYDEHKRRHQKKNRDHHTEGW